MLHHCDTPAQAALSLCKRMQGESLTLGRCAGTLRLYHKQPHWRCSLCSRTYTEAPAAAGPACIFCGVPLGLPQPQGTVQRVPALELGLKL